MRCYQQKLIMDALISSHFNYCPLVWMCHSRTLNNQVNRIHHRALSIVYRDYTSSFQTLLNKADGVSIHHRNIQHLAIEIYKAQHNLSPTIMTELFKPKEAVYNFRSESNLQSFVPRTMTYGIHSISYLAPRIWSMLPTAIKNSSNLSTFKMLIKQWKPYSCPCKLCKRYIQNLGYL